MTTRTMSRFGFMLLVYRVYTLREKLTEDEYQRAVDWLTTDSPDGQGAPDYRVELEEQRGRHGVSREDVILGSNGLHSCRYEFGSYEAIDEASASASPEELIELDRVLARSARWIAARELAHETVTRARYKHLM